MPYGIWLDKDCALERMDFAVMSLILLILSIVIAWILLCGGNAWAFIVAYWFVSVIRNFAIFIKDESVEMEDADDDIY